MRNTAAPDLLEVRFEVADPALSLAPHFGVAGFLGVNGEAQHALRSGGQLGVSGGLAPGDAVGLLFPEPEDLVQETLALLGVHPHAEVPVPGFITQEYPAERMVNSFKASAKSIAQALPSAYELEAASGSASDSGAVGGAGAEPYKSFVLRQLLEWEDTEGTAPFEGRTSLPDAEIPRRLAYASEDGVVPAGLPKAPLPPLADPSPGAMRQRDVCRIGDGLGKLWKLSNSQDHLIAWCMGCLTRYAEKNDSVDAKVLHGSF